MNLKEKLALKAKPINDALEKYLKIREPKKLYKASAHIPLAGGKRLRPVMALITCEMVGGDSKKAIPFAAALETIHNFTLVHDDVMDDDDLRHGVDACHTVYGLSTAILAGDTLFAYAFEMTSILFGAAAYGGAKIGGTTEEEARELEQMATNVGLGFQIWDDYLDATASEEILGKPSGSDIRQGKRTLLVIEALNKADEKDQKKLIQIYLYLN